LKRNGKAGRAATLAWALCGLMTSSVSAHADESNGTRVIVTGYLFGSAIKGQASPTSGLPPADIDLSFSDVLQDLDFGFMTAVEVRKGRWGFVGDLMYSNVSPSATVPGPLPLTGSLDQKSLTLQGNVFYRVHEGDGINVDLGAGLRYWNIKNVGTLDPGRIGFSHRETWIDPVLVARMTARIDGPWSVTLAGDVGGSGGGSDLTWQLLGTVNYQKNDRFTFRAGYRVLSVDYNQDGFVYDVAMRGPVIGVSMSF
jgi:hypothetical protein